MKLSDLHPNPGNPRRISKKQLEMLGKSLREFGDLSGIIFNRRSGFLVGGHQRAQELDPKAQVTITERFDPPTPTGTVAVGFVMAAGERFTYREVDWDELTERAANIAANKHGGDWDLPKLGEWLLEQDAHNRDPELLGFEFKELEDLLAPLRTTDEERAEKEDQVPEVPKQAVTKPGDLWVLGEHRLLCGDSTKRKDVERLMSGKKADMVFTDPPYGVSYADKNAFLNTIALGKRIQKRIEADHGTVPEMFELWKKVFNVTAEFTSNKASYYICSPQGGELMMMMQAIDQSPWSLKHTLIWAKNNHVLGRCDYHYKHEPILYGWKKKGTHVFHGAGKHTKSVWEVPKPHNSDLHPTTKPIELPENALLNSTTKGHLVLDIFLGSGSTLIACEKTGRRCFGMEIDPLYCDVIVKRWEEYTGRKAERA